MLNAAVMVVCFSDVLRLFGQAEHDWLRAELDAWWMSQATAEFPDDEPFPCADNFRLALKGDEASYEEAVCNGCCGSVDIEVGPSPSGRTYLYGFNYGH